MLGAESGHGGDEYEQIVSGGEILVGLHAIDVEDHHGRLADPDQPVGDGVLLRFEVAASRPRSIRSGRRARPSSATCIRIPTPVSRRSADGRKLAFLADGGCGQFCFNLYVVNSDGSGLRNLTSKLAAGGRVGAGPASDPAWSPDGRKIAFVRLNAGLGDPIYVVKADGSGLRNLTPKPVGAYAAPAWSPDGRKIAFVSDRRTDCDLCFHVWVMNADGSGHRNLTRNPGHPSPRAFRPSWSPDGRKIAFVNHRDGNADVYVMDRDGSGQRNLTRNPADDDDWPAWSPGRAN